MAKALNILVLFDTAGTPPANQDFSQDFKNNSDWKAERDVITTLKKLGHKVDTLGIYDDITLLTKRISQKCPDIVFNLTEHFLGEASFDRHIVGLLELMKIPYTGSPPSGLFLAKNKGLAKTVMAHHKILTPAFTILNRGKKNIPGHLRYPLIVKPLREEASYGITQKSLVTNKRALQERIAYVHDEMLQDAIVEEFIEGREIYVSLLGNLHPTVFPLREMLFSKVNQKNISVLRQQSAMRQQFATFKVKWDQNYRKKQGIKNVFANFSQKTQKEIEAIAKKTYEVLYLRGYARLDLRVTNAGEVYVIEANPNPHIAKDEDFSLSAKKGGLLYPDLLQKIIDFGLSEHKKFFAHL